MHLGKCLHVNITQLNKMKNKCFPAGWSLQSCSADRVETLLSHLSSVVFFRIAGTLLCEEKAESLMVCGTMGRVHCGLQQTLLPKGLCWEMCFTISFFCQVLDFWSLLGLRIYLRLLGLGNNIIDWQAHLLQGFNFFLTGWLVFQQNLKRLTKVS